MNKKSKDELAEHCTLGQIGGSGGLTYFWVKKVAKIIIFGSIFTHFEEKN